MNKGNTSARHLDQLDGIRGLALILVMIFHAGIFPGYLHISAQKLPAVIAPIVLNGAIGVDLFFVLSGFLITGILLRTRTAPNYFQNFYARRALRIFPLYFLAVAFWVVMIPVLDTPDLTAGTASYWPWIATLTSNLLIAWKGSFGAVPRAMQHFWSLAIEEQYYLIWPFVVARLSRRGLVRFCGLLILGAPIVRGVLLATTSGDTSYVFTLGRFDGLAMGSLLAIVSLDRELASAVRVWLKRLAAPGFLIYAVTRFFPQGHGLWNRTLGFTAINIFFVALLAMSLENGRLESVLRMRWLTWLGRRSYGAYILHQPFLIAFCLFVPLMKNLPLLFFIPVPFLCLPLAEVLWHVWEKPFLKLKRHFAPIQPVVEFTEIHYDRAQ